MNKIALVVFSIFVVSVIALLTYYHINKYAYSKELRHTPQYHEQDSILTIAIIGDSWVNGNVMDSLLYKTLLDKNVKSKTISSGEGGATSKQVYQNLFKDSLDVVSSKFILNAKPDYCIVLVGVNDSALQYGGHFYSYHLRLIIKTLLEQNIKPVILSLPEFGIRETTKNLRFVSKIRNKISSIINNDKATDEIKDYRETFLNEFKQEGLSHKIIYVNFDKVTKDYYSNPELYSNSSHLSQIGNQKLVSVLADAIMKHQR